METPAAESTPVTPASTLNSILERCPSAGQILVQMGQGYVNRRGDLYAQYPDLSVAQYAELNGLDTARVVDRLAAAVEAEEMARKGRPPARAAREDAASVRRTPLAIGYTSSYDERLRDGQGAVPFTVVYSEGGPD
jgi:hypothetical protein